MTKALLHAIAILILYGCSLSPDLSAGDKAILDYASKPYNKAEMMHKRVVIGEKDRAPVVADFPCGDICPDYTVRVIHYELQSGQICSDLGGAERRLRVVRGRAANDEMFCFPKVISDNWSRYIK